MGDESSATSILNCETARDAKRLGYNIQGYNSKTWYEKGYDLCQPGIKAKYLQNPTLLNMLRITSPKLLVESSPDKNLGDGHPPKR